MDNISKIHIVNGFSKHKNNDSQLVTSPFIALRGKWLATCGFSPNDKVLIRARKGLVVVKLLKNE